MSNNWSIRNVPPEVQNKIKAKAAIKGLTIGQLIIKWAETL